MKKTRKGLMPALLGAVCSVVALTSVSYAWFTMGNEANIGKLDVDVQAADGMQISHDASVTSFGSSLNMAKLDEISTNIFTNDEVTLAPVSTDGKVGTDGKLKLFQGSMDSNNKLVASAATSGQYIVFDFYVKLDKESTVYLDAGSYVKDAADSEKLSSYAARVGFVYLGTADYDGEYKPSDATGLNGAGIDNNVATIWEPNHLKHTSEAATTNNTTKVEYSGISSIDENGTPTKASVTTITPAYGDDAAITEEGSNQAALFDLPIGVSKVRVYVWLEGEDVDCTNIIDEGHIEVLINLTKTTKAVPSSENE